MIMGPNFHNETSITKFQINGKTVYVKFVWNACDDDLFHMKLFDGNSTWSGKLTKESAKKYCVRCQETEDQYIRNVKRFLKESGRNDVTYDFVYKEDSELANFTWKKRFEDLQGSIFLVHGSVQVKVDQSAESKDILIDHLLEENRELRTTIESLTEKQNNITTELKKSRAELEKFVDIKTELESSLYGKFVELLNAKKRRIQVLEGSVQKFSDMNDLSGDH